MVNIPPNNSNFALAKCSPMDSVADLVAIQIPGSLLGKYQVFKAEPDTSGNIPTRMPCFGVIVKKTSPTDCVIQIAGVCSVYSSLQPGRIYYCGQSARPVLDIPTPLNGYFYIQSVGIATAANRLLLNFGLDLTSIS